jgi:polyphosphate:AMP phosphotransferase
LHGATKRFTFGKTFDRKRERAMLEMVDLKQRLKKQDYQDRAPRLEIKLAELQRRAKQLEVPVIIVLAGWDASGKGVLINRLVLSLDPRSYDVHAIDGPDQEGGSRPFLWRFWTRIPSRGRLGVFAGGWYRHAVNDRVEKRIKKRVWLQELDQIRSFEKQLVDDGYVIVKFFLHISEHEQAKRLTKLDKNPSTTLRVTSAEWRRHEKYGKYLAATEELLAATSTETAPWTIVAAHDRRFATVKIFQTVIDAIERRCDSTARKPSRKSTRAKAEPTVGGSGSPILDGVDLSSSLERRQYERVLDEYQKKIGELQWKVMASKLPVILLYEGWDAAGKGGNIRRLVQALDPRGYRVVPVSAPNDLERAHHYLWRFWNRVPRGGRITIFDRSWYGRVLVERVEGLARSEEWQRAFREINELEQSLVEFGSVLIKFWLHIDPDEQLRRFKRREQIRHKRWKITDDDWRNREKWDQYRVAVEEMLQRTSTSYAPWTILPANSKLYARIEALKTVEREISSRLNL